MTAFDKDIAVRCFDESRPNREGDMIARYWLSLWRGDQLPRRADFEPKKVAGQLRAIGLFDVVPGQSIRCRLIGSGLSEAIGENITGRELSTITEPKDWPTRLQRWSDVARGGIGRGLRPGYRESGEQQLSEELLLPFGDVTENGSRQVLLHVSWQQTAYNPTQTGIGKVTGLALEFRLANLRAA